MTVPDGGARRFPDQSYSVCVWGRGAGGGDLAAHTCQAVYDCENVCVAMSVPMRYECVYECESTCLPPFR